MALPQPDQSSETVLYILQPHQTHSASPPNYPQDPPPSYSAATAAPTSSASSKPQPYTITPPTPPPTPPPPARTPSRPRRAIVVNDAMRQEIARCQVIINRISTLSDREADAVLPAPVTAPASSRRARAENGWREFFITVVAGVVCMGGIIGLGVLLHRFVH